MHPELLILRLVHVLGGIAWAGSALFYSLFLGPALAASGSSAPPVMAALRARRFLTFMPVVALLTIGSGLRLLWITSGGLSPGYFASPHGQAFSIAGASAIAAFCCATFIMRPAQARSAALGAELAQATEARRSALALELAAVTRRSALASTVALTMLMIGAGGMAVARYLG